MGLKPISLKQIRPDHLKTYLMRLGFFLDKPWGENAEVWRIQKSNFPVIVPVNPEEEDYPMTVRDVIEKVSQLQKLSPVAVFQNVINRGFNRFDVRASSKETRAGQISFDFYPELVCRLKPILRSAGWSVVTQRPWHLGQPPKPVDALLKQTRVGQSDIGSYIMTFYVPKEVELEKQQTQMFGQFAIENMQRSISVLEGVSKEGRFDSDTVSEFPKLGVTVNVCDSVADILALGQGQNLDLGFRFLIEAEQESPSIGNFKYRLKSADCDVVRSLGRSLRKQVKEEKFSADGFIIRLGRDEGTGSPGTVTMLTKIGTGRRKLNFTLTTPNYEKIVSAHRDGLKVTVRGTLRNQKNRYFIENPYGLEVHSERVGPEAPSGEQLLLDDLLSEES